MKKILLLTSLVILIASCERDKEIAENQNEIIGKNLSPSIWEGVIVKENIPNYGIITFVDKTKATRRSYLVVNGKIENDMTDEGTYLAAGDSVKINWPNITWRGTIRGNTLTFPKAGSHAETFVFTKK